VRPTLLQSHRDYLPFGHSLSVFLAALACNETSKTVHICSPYHSILAPDRVTLAVPIPLTVPLNRVHCPRRFRPHPCRMAGRIREVEFPVALAKYFQYKTNISLYNIYLCNLVSQITSCISGISQRGSCVRQ